jgi:four helix bundle protein
VATGSAYELETQFLLAESFGYVPAEQTLAMCQRLDELQRMLYGLHQSLGE